MAHKQTWRTVKELAKADGSHTKYFGLAQARTYLEPENRAN